MCCRSKRDRAETLEPAAKGSALQHWLAGKRVRAELRNRASELRPASCARLDRQIGRIVERLRLLTRINDDGVRECRQNLLLDARPGTAELGPPIGFIHIGAARDDEIHEGDDARQLPRRDDGIAAFKATPERFGTWRAFGGERALGESRRSSQARRPACRSSARRASADRQGEAVGLAGSLKQPDLVLRRHDTRFAAPS